MKLALETCVPAVTKEEMGDISHVLKIPGDKREGQVIASYDRFYKAIKGAAEEYGFPVPAAFQLDQIDRRSSTYFNTNMEVNKGRRHEKRENFRQFPRGGGRQTEKSKGRVQT